jgi:hypothetical protein
MKMVKSLLLVSAAGLVAVSGAQAADLPVKAKPVEYVKVCSLYGAGFYYVPGTDICLKIGAYFRAEYAVGNMASSLTNLDAIGADGQRTRLTGPDYQQRARAFVFLDTRQQTAYGTLRAYMNIGWTTDFPTTVGTSAAAVYANRAFMQLAGFTWGVATSYYDFFSSPATSYTVPWSSDSGDGGWKVAAYTAQLGNGLSATLSLEEPRRQVVTNNSVLNVAATSVYPVGANPTQDELKVKWPTVVANLRVDQAWGAAQIMGAVQNVGGGYFGGTVGGGSCATGAALVNGNVCSGHPQDEIGFAIGAGIKINFPMIGPGDYFQAQVNYTEGAVRFAALTPSSAGGPGIFGSGGVAGTAGTLGLGYFNDASYANGTGLNLTTAWSAQAAYEHYWTPSLRTSLVGAYTDISYNDAASAQMCTNVNTLGVISANGISGVVGPGGTACGAGTFDWSYWSVSSRTQWNITKEFYVGLEGFYGHLNTMNKGGAALYTASGTGAQPTGVRIFDDQEVFVYRMRVHRDLVP